MSNDAIVIIRVYRIILTSLLNFAGVALPVGLSIGVSVMWTETAT